jgi:glycosyltransferase involved in cell wall biosynthesis
MKPLKIALIFGTYPPMKDGGAEFVYNLASGLSRRGVAVTVITTSRVADNYLKGEGADITVLPIIEKWHGRKDFKSLTVALKEASPDLIHLVYPSSYFGNDYRLPFEIKAICRAPLVTTFFSLFKTGSYLRTRIGTLRLILSSDRLVTHNYDYANFFRKFFPFKKRDIYHIPVGNNMPAVKGSVNKPELRKKYGLDRDTTYLSFSGQMDISKGIETLFCALKILVKQGRKDVRLIMVGSGDRERIMEGRGYAEKILHYAKTIFDLQDRLGLSDYIKWTAYLTPEEFNEYMLSSDICVLPFRGNTLGRSSLMNALSLGIPVITTAPQNTPFLKNGENAAIVPPDDPARLADVISSLLADPESRRRIGEGGMRLFEEEFTWDSIVDRTISLYEELK